MYNKQSSHLSPNPIVDFVNFFSLGSKHYLSFIDVHSTRFDRSSRENKPRTPETEKVYCTYKHNRCGPNRLQQ